MRKMILLRNLMFLLFTCFVYGQYPIPFQDIKSPEVSLFERYGNTPISNYSGRPNVSIPLYTISHGDITVPLSIVYNSNGIRVDEEASQFGLGWYFATGMISQIRNGKNDLLANVFVEQPDYYTGTMGYVIDPDNNSIIRTPSVPNNSLNQYFVGRIRSKGLVEDRFDCFNLLSCDGSFFYPKNNLAKNYGNVVNSTNYEDFEIDYFRANFFGHELTFYINPRQSATAPFTFTVINKEKYKIQLVNDNWIITDPNGVEYYFNERKLAVASSSSSYTDPNLNSTQSGYILNASPSSSIDFSQYSSATWKITKIKDTKGNEVVFNYDQLPNSSTISFSNKYELMNLSKACSGAGNLNSNSQYFGPQVNNDFEQGVKDYVSINASYLAQQNSILKEIIFADSKVSFINSQRLDSSYDKKTESMSIYYKTNIVKSINFTYDYFNSSSSDNLQKRLKLMSLSFGYKPYFFEYNPIDTPNKNSLSYDYWGFYNGMPNTSVISNPFRLYPDPSLIPSWAKPYLALLDGKCNRSAHPEFCKAGMLEKIIYPTGGYTTIEYELNEFDNLFFPNYNNRIGVDSDNNFLTSYSQNSSKGFGLRVKKTTNYVDQENYVINNYSYFGGKHINPYTGYRQEQVSYQNYNNGVDINSQSYNVCFYNGVAISSNNTLLFQNSFLGNGSNVGYDAVSVEQISNTGQGNGKTRYYYTNVPDLSPSEKFDNGYSASIGFNPSDFDSFGSSIRNSDIDNGLLIKEEIYDKNNSIKRKVDYGYLSEMPVNNVKFNLKLLPTGNYFNSKLVYCFSNCQSECAQIKYFNFNEYLLFYFPLKISNTKKASEKVTEYFPTGAKWTQTEYSYDSNNMPIGKKVKDQFGNYFYEESSTMATSADLINKNILSLPLSTIVRENGIIKKDNQFLYSLINNSYQLTKVEELPSGSSDPLKKINVFYDLFDAQNDLLQFHRENSTYTSVIWGYNKTLPVAKLENVMYSTIQPSLITAIEVASNTGTEAQLLDALNNLRNSLPSAMITTYTHIPLVGVKTITDPKGDKMTYTYDSFGRLQNVKDKEGNILSENEYHYKPQN